MVPILSSNAAFFGAAVVLVLAVSFVLSRLLGRLLGKGGERELLRAMIVRRTRRILTLMTALLCLGLVVAAALLTVHEVDAAPHAWGWLAQSVLLDPIALAWLLGQLLVLLVGAWLLHRTVGALVRFTIGKLQGNLALLKHQALLDRLEQRLATLLRWGVLFGALLATAVLLSAPALVRDPLTSATFIACVILGARALVVVAHVGVDIGVQLIRAFEGRRSPLRFLGRLEHLAGITKRTLEYFCFVGAATLVVGQLRPDAWMSQSGLVLIRLIALVYVGRVVIEVCGLVLREVLLANAERRTETEQQQRLTLVPIFTSILRYGVYFCMTVMGLQEIGVDTSPILAGAGLLGLAVGLGAQTLVGDIVSGFFILFEGMFLVGDRVRIGEVVGNVEEIGVRVLKIRDEFGVLHGIPNGEVRLVANHACQYVNAVVEFSLPYDEDIPAILEHLRAQLSEKRGMHPDILSDTDFSIQGLMDTGALIRSLTRVKPSCDDSVGDVIRVELYTLLTQLGVMPSACYVIKTSEVRSGRAGVKALAPEPAPARAS